MEATTDNHELKSLLYKAVWCGIIGVLLGSTEWLSSILLFGYSSSMLTAFKDIISTVLQITAFIFLLRAYRVLQHEDDWRAMDHAIAKIILLMAIIAIGPMILFIVGPIFSQANIHPIEDTSSSLYSGAQLVYVISVLLLSSLLIFLIPIFLFNHPEKSKVALILSFLVGFIASAFPPQLSSPYEREEHKIVMEGVRIPEGTEEESPRYENGEHEFVYPDNFQPETIQFYETKTIAPPEIPGLLLLAYCFTRPRKDSIATNKEATVTTET